MIADSFVVSFFPPSSDKDAMTSNTPKNHIQLENKSQFPRSKDYFRIQDFTSQWTQTPHVFESLQQV